MDTMLVLLFIMNPLLEFVSVSLTKVETRFTKVVVDTRLDYSSLPSVIPPTFPRTPPSINGISISGTMSLTATIYVVAVKTPGLATLRETLSETLNVLMVVLVVGILHRTVLTIERCTYGRITLRVPVRATIAVITVSVGVIAKMVSDETAPPIAEALTLSVPVSSMVCIRKNIDRVTMKRITYTFNLHTNELDPKLTKTFLTKNPTQQQYKTPQSITKNF